MQSTIEQTQDHLALGLQRARLSDRYSLKDTHGCLFKYLESIQGLAVADASFGFFDRIFLEVASRLLICALTVTRFVQCAKGYATLRGFI